MPDTEPMKLEFDKNVRFGWREVISIGVILFSLGGLYITLTRDIQDSAVKTSEVSARQIERAALVDGKLEKIDDKISQLKQDIAVSQSNQAVISKQISDLRDDLRSDRARPAVYRTGGSN